MLANNEAQEGTDPNQALHQEKHKIKNTKKQRTSKKWCSCGFKKHGPNHEQGYHHRHISLKK